MSEVFRFMAVRPPTEARPDDGHSIRAFADAKKSQVLAGIRGAADRQSAISNVKKQLKVPLSQQSSDLAAVLERASKSLDAKSTTEGLLRALSVTTWPATGAYAFGQSDGEHPVAGAVPGEWLDLRNQLADRLLGRRVAGRQADRGCDFLTSTIVRCIRLIEICQQLQKGAVTDQALRRLAYSRILLPTYDDPAAPKDGGPAQARPAAGSRIARAVGGGRFTPAAIRSVFARRAPLPDVELVDELDAEAEAGEPAALARSVAPVRPNTVASYRIGNRVYSGVPLRLDGVWTLPGSGAVPRIEEGRVSPVRVGELDLVRQRFVRYETTEIAHIENVLPGESHHRDFTRASTSETETTVSETRMQSQELDLQSTQRFDLKSAMTESSHLGVEAGVSVSASYGGTVEVEAGTQFSASQDKATEAATTFARESTSRAVNRIESQVSEEKRTRITLSTHELTHHGVDNSKGDVPTRGVYRWLNKVYEAQTINYGLRNLYDVYVPEPAALYRHVQRQAGVRHEGVTIDEPLPPAVEVNGVRRPLEPTDLDEIRYTTFVAQYGATNVPVPPPYELTIGAVLKTEPAADMNPPKAGVLTQQLTIPVGYRASRLMFRADGHELGNGGYTVLFGGGRWFSASRGTWLTTDHLRDQQQLGLSYDDYYVLAVGVSIICRRTSEHFRQWQLDAYAAIMVAYLDQRATYDDQVNAANADRETKVAGRNPLENEAIIRDELKRAVLTVITGQHFAAFDAMQAPDANNPFPELDLGQVATEGRYVAFFEQAFEWQNMTFVLYPYFWANKGNWEQMLGIEDIDPLFGRFLRAGYARVQVPVRPGFEAAVEATLDPANWSGEVIDDADIPGWEAGSALLITDELRIQTGGDTFVAAGGTVSTTAGSADIKGAGTTFTVDRDGRREIRIDGTTYVIETVDEATQIVTVEAPAPSGNLNGVRYQLGPRRVGFPWEIVVPSTLVYLQEDANLNP